VCVVATPDAVTLRWKWPFSHTVLAVVETPAVATVAVRTRLVRSTVTVSVSVRPVASMRTDCDTSVAVSPVSRVRTSDAVRSAVLLRVGSTFVRSIRQVWPDCTSKRRSGLVRRSLDPAVRLPSLLTSSRSDTTSLIVP
jgi:hypothetical protein